MDTKVRPNHVRGKIQHASNHQTRPVPAVAYGLPAELRVTGLHLVDVDQLDAHALARLARVALGGR